MGYSKRKSIISWFLEFCREIRDISWMFSLMLKILCGIKTYGTLRSIPHTYFCKLLRREFRHDRPRLTLHYKIKKSAILIEINEFHQNETSNSLFLVVFQLNRSMVFLGVRKSLFWMFSIYLGPTARCGYYNRMILGLQTPRAGNGFAL